MLRQDFILDVIFYALADGYKVEASIRNNGLQIDFGNKKLNAKHLEELYPDILCSDANISDIIDKVAKGRPCTHKPMKKIIEKIREERGV